MRCQRPRMKRCLMKKAWRGNIITYFITFYGTHSSLLCWSTTCYLMLWYALHLLHTSDMHIALFIFFFAVIRKVYFYDSNADQESLMHWRTSKFLSMVGTMTRRKLKIVLQSLPLVTLRKSEKPSSKQLFRNVRITTGKTSQIMER